MSQSRHSPALVVPGLLDATIRGHSGHSVGQSGIGGCNPASCLSTEQRTQEVVESLHLGHLLVDLGLGGYRREEDLRFGVSHPPPRHATLQSWRGVSEHERRMFS